jgi:hypothetical protein
LSYERIIERTLTIYHVFFDCQGDFAETSNYLEHPAASKERDQFTIISLIVKGEIGASPENLTLL